MRDYEDQIKAFTLPETAAQTEAYFDKFWLGKGEYEDKWLPLQRRIFDVHSNGGICVSFHEGFEILPLIGGLIFAPDDFILFQKCMSQRGDGHFVIVEDYDEDDPPHDSGPPLRFRYPAATDWELIMSGGYVSTELFRMPHKNYFVFGDTASWGKYVANDHTMPLDILGFRIEYRDLFLAAFGPLFRERENEIMEALPLHLRNLVSTR